MTDQQSRLSGARVLVVEDEYLIADELVGALRKAGAQALGPINNLKDALGFVRRERPDAVILDLNLRGEIASALTSELEAQSVPCLIVSGYGSNAFPEGLENVPSMEKPVVYSEVTAKLAEILGSKGEPTN